ncbi:MAG: hypothetical protein Ct9H90mP27_2450 [Gammaproteobacteria bacterium]|nr:MAG: hypothetical protein Ct9H90mP27_2450 [Gammaproteobacteria bacterium]
MGFFLIGVAIWLIERLVEDSVAMILWGLLFIGAAVYFGALSCEQGSRSRRSSVCGGGRGYLGRAILVGSSLGSSSILILGRFENL